MSSNQKPFMNNPKASTPIVSSALLGGMIEALTRIANCTDAPDIDATGEWQIGLHCGVEDRDCRDRYDGADFGHAVGVEKALEWASNEAKHALSKLPNDQKLSHAASDSRQPKTRSENCQA